MTAIASPNAIAFAFVFRRQAAPPPALRIRAPSGPIWLASDFRASSSSPLKALECPQPTARNLQIAPVAASPSSNRPPNSKPPPRFPHSA